jgi:tRNA A37 threonylcarbamoyladenosine biosynthesis protein TsaE
VVLWFLSGLLSESPAFALQRSYSYSTRRRVHDVEYWTESDFDTRFPTAEAVAAVERQVLVEWFHRFEAECRNEQVCKRKQQSMI